jgi:hypothetical protein
MSASGAGRFTLALDEGNVAAIVLLKHRAGLELEVGDASLLEVLDGARGVIGSLVVLLKVATMILSDMELS